MMSSAKKRMIIRNLTITLVNFSVSTFNNNQISSGSVVVSDNEKAITGRFKFINTFY